MSSVSLLVQHLKDSQFSRFVAGSVLFHILIVVVFIIGSRYTRFTLQYKPKSVTIRVEQTDSRKLLKKMRRLKKVVSRRKIETCQADSINKRVLMREDVSMIVIHREYEPEEFTHRMKNINFEAEDPFQDEGLDIKAPDFEIEQETSPIRFKNGQTRQLLVDHRDQLRALNLDASIRCRVVLQINQLGIVIFVDILESSGDIATDQQILSIIRGWQFSEGSMPVQEAEVMLRYYL